MLLNVYIMFFNDEIRTDVKLLCLTQMWCEYDLQENLAMCDEAANYLLEGALPTVSVRF